MHAALVGDLHLESRGTESRLIVCEEALRRTSIIVSVFAAR